MRNEINAPKLEVRQPIQGQSDEVTDNLTQLVTYSNLTGVSISPEEVFFHFGQRRQDNPHIADGVAKVYMSPGAFKRLAVNLVMILKRYEDAFGEIPDPAKTVTPEAIQKFQKMGE